MGTAAAPAAGGGLGAGVGACRPLELKKRDSARSSDGRSARLGAAFSGIWWAGVLVCSEGSAAAAGASVGATTSLLVDQMSAAASSALAAVRSNPSFAPDESAIFIFGNPGYPE